MVKIERGWILLDSKGKRVSGFYQTQVLLHAVYAPRGDKKGFKEWLKKYGYRIACATLTWS